MTMTYPEFKPWLNELKWRNPEAYRKAIVYSEGVALKHELPLPIAVDVEQAAVMLTCELLGITPAARSSSND
jgi:acetyl-CoA carboxylase alpha subunit